LYHLSFFRDINLAQFELRPSPQAWRVTFRYSITSCGARDRAWKAPHAKLLRASWRLIANLELRGCCERQRARERGRVSACNEQTAALTTALLCLRAPPFHIIPNLS